MYFVNTDSDDDDDDVGSIRCCSSAAEAWC